jgi:hypothetical protein
VKEFGIEIDEMNGATDRGNKKGNERLEAKRETT